MADDVVLALQKALIAHLRADVDLTALVAGRVYDEPPQIVVLPYVRIGTMILTPERLSCGADHVVTFGIEVFSRPVAGRVEATRICAAVRACLDQQEPMIAVTGFTLEWLDYLTQTVAREGDGRSYAGTVAFEAALSA